MTKPEEFARHVVRTLLDEFPLSLGDLFRCFGISVFVFTVIKLFGVENEPALATLAVVLVGLLAFWTLSSLAGAQHLSFQAKVFEEGAGTYHDLINAKRIIVVSHFAGVVPTGGYVALMKESLDQGVQVIRYLPKGVDRSLTQNMWLSEFQGDKHYVEKPVEGVSLPFDIFVFDDQIAQLQFPSSHEDSGFSTGIRLEDARVATKMREALYLMAARRKQSA